MSDMENAKRILTEGGYTCAAVCGNDVYTSRQRGVRPLLDLLDAGKSLKGYSVADKVVGRAAAFLYVRLETDEVYSGIISKPALDVFRQFGIRISYGELVDVIFNRTNTGLCPMESSVLGIREPETAEQAIRAKLAELTANLP